MGGQKYALVKQDTDSVVTEDVKYKDQEGSTGYVPCAKEMSRHTWCSMYSEARPLFLCLEIICSDTSCEAFLS